MDDLIIRLLWIILLYMLFIILIILTYRRHVIKHMIFLVANLNDYMKINFVKNLYS